MKRAEVWWVHFEPAVGGEVRKERPAVIVSNDASNGWSRRGIMNFQEKRGVPVARGTQLLVAIAKKESFLANRK